MTKKYLPSVETLHKLLVCDFCNGKLYWRPRDVCMFSGKSEKSKLGSMRRWNGIWADKEAFTESSTGYLRGRIGGKNYRAHRTIWAMYHSKWPELQIDHINHVKTDNRIINLREVSQAEPSAESKARVNAMCENVGAGLKMSKPPVVYKSRRGADWYPRDPRKFIAGVKGMTFKECNA